MLSICIQYVFVFHYTCYICDSRMVIRGQLIVVEINSIMSGRSPPLCYTLTTLVVMQGHQTKKQIVMEINSIMSERSLPLCYTLTTLLIVMQGHQTNEKQTKKQKQCSTSSNMVVIIYCFIGCRNKTSTWYLNGFPDGGNLGSTV